MSKIAIFYHCLFVMGDPPSPLEAAESIVSEQMDSVQNSGLWDSASEFHVGVNGTPKDSGRYVKEYLPENAHIKYHGLASKNECSTIAQLEDWLPGHEDWLVLYFHSKGATWPITHQLSINWRRCMMFHLVHRWTRCVRDLSGNAEAVGCHWFEYPRTPIGQYVFGGNFWMAKASFLRTLPSIHERARIKQDGIEALSSRYESEVWLGNGPRPPKVVDYHPNWFMTQEPHR